MARTVRFRIHMLLTFLIVNAIGALFVYIAALIYGIPLEYVAGIVVLMMFLQWWLGPSAVRRSTNLVYIKPGDIPNLEAMIARLSSKAGIKPPRLAIVPSMSPNAFVFGRTRKSSTLTVHQGLFNALEPAEVEAVIGHEIGHLRHNDCVIMTVVSTVPIFLYTFARYFRGLADESLGRNIAQSLFAAVSYIIAVVFYLFYYIVYVLVMGLSRSREYYADSYSAFLTDDPSLLENALAKISYGLSLKPPQDKALRTFHIGDAHLAAGEVMEIIENKGKYDLDHNGKLDAFELQLAMHDQFDLNRDGVLDGHELQFAMKKRVRSIFDWIDDLLSTHPPTFERISRLDKLKEKEPAPQSRIIY